MSYIYKITNKINGKLYIGQTSNTIANRWKEHCKNLNKENCKDRPLYRAMKKYGIENFLIEQVEECSENLVLERERYWIEYFGSFKYGYNATLGGDGRPYIDYDLVCATYKNVQSIKDTSEILQIDTHTVSKILKVRGEKVLTQPEVITRKIGKVINQFDLSHNFIASFPSSMAAARSVVSPEKSITSAATHIRDVCRGKRKTAYGYLWKFEINE